MSSEENSSEAIVPERIITYKEVDGRSLAMHLFEPSTDGSEGRPCVLLIHSGGWVNGSPERYYHIAKPLREMGLVVACIQYRLYDPKANPPVSVPDAVEDAQDAMHYLKQHADSLGLDRERTIACGGSAGAHLVAGLALFDCEHIDAALLRPKVMVLFNPVIDTSAEGYGHQKLGADWEAYSPLHRLQAGLPPTLIFHGTGDRTTPYGGSAAFSQRAQQNGDVCVLITHDGGDHGYYNAQPLFDQTMQRVREFLVEHNILEKGEG